MVLLFLGYAFLFSPLCFCCPKIVTVTIHFGRWSDQIGYIPCEGMSYFPPNNSYFVDISLAFRIKGKLHVWELFLKDKTSATPGILQLAVQQVSVEKWAREKTKTM